MTSSYELYGRICVGAPLKPEAALALHVGFCKSLGLDELATSEQIFLALLDEAPKHKKHEPDRVRYERAFESYIDAECEADMAIGGLSEHGVFDPKKNYLFVGVCVDEFVTTLSSPGRGAAAPDRPQWITWGALGSNSTLGKSFELDRNGEKAWDHARRSYQRANKDITKDAFARIARLAISKQHEPGWALCRWLVDSAHPSIEHR
jgi:hypothetical protein